MSLAKKSLAKKSPALKFPAGDFVTWIQPNSINRDLQRFVSVLLKNDHQPTLLSELRTINRCQLQS